jgi:hypothetical protein
MRRHVNLSSTTSHDSIAQTPLCRIIYQLDHGDPLPPDHLGTLAPRRS